MQQLISKCRYYRGEDECPLQIKDKEKCNLWYYESLWVEWKGEYEDNGEYEYHGLHDFEANDGVPLSLKKILFNRFTYWGGGYGNDAELFKEWYLRHYKGMD
jgi:hypothetical protein